MKKFLCVFLTLITLACLNSCAPITTVDTQAQNQKRQAEFAELEEILERSREEETIQN